MAEDCPGGPPVLGRDIPAAGPRPPLPAARRRLGRGRGGEGGQAASPGRDRRSWRPGARRSSGPLRQEDRRPQAVPGPAAAGPRGPRRVPLVPGHRAPAHLRTRDQPPHQRLGSGQFAGGVGGDAPRPDRLGPDDAGHPVLAAEDRDGRLVRPVVLAGRARRRCSTARTRCTKRPRARCRRRFAAEAANQPRWTPTRPSPRSGRWTPSSARPRNS